MAEPKQAPQIPVDAPMLDEISQPVWARNDKIVKVKVKNVAFLLEPDDTLAKLPENLEVKDSAGDTLDRSTPVRLAFLGGTTLILHPEKTQPEAPALEKLPPERYISPYYSHRTQSLQKIFQLWQKKSVILVRSPPYTGKTMLAYLLVRFLSSLKKKLIFLDLATLSLTHPFSFLWRSQCDQEFSTFVQTNKECYLIFDEFQTTYKLKTDDPFWSQMKSLIDGFTTPNVKIICFAGYGSTDLESDISTPINFNANNGTVASLDLLLLSPQEMTEFAEGFKRTTNLVLIDDWLPIISQQTGGHIGLMHLMFERFRLQNFAKYLHSPEIHYDVLKETRVLSGFRKKMISVPKECIKLLKVMICHQGPLRIEKYQEKFANQLVKAGYITYLKEPLVTFACPLIQDVVHRELYLYKSRPEACVYSNLQEFCFHVLSNFRQKLFQKSISLLTNDRISEKFWQSEFYAAASKFLSDGIYISSEVPRGAGVIDFMLINGFRWGVELLIDGRNLQEHMDRFYPGSIYQAEKMQEWLVIDFRPLGQMKPDDLISLHFTGPRPSANLWIAYYESSYGCLYLINNPGSFIRVELLKSQEAK